LAHRQPDQRTQFIDGKTREREHEIRKTGKRTTSTGAAGNGDPFKTYADAVAPTTIIGTLLKFSKGEFFAGKDSRPVAVGTHFIDNLDATMAGWVKWINGRPIDHRLVRIADGLLPVKREQLGDTDTEQLAIRQPGRAS
jgi:hypothetical protein